MSKLKLCNVKKSYKSGEVVTALKGISLEFRESEFVAILGPSGCGKTTLLNIIGGLDRYDSGDLILSGLSTKNFKDKDWDAYRNNSIGFIFQNYNLISHQSVLQNVEIALTLSGVSVKERKERAFEALKAVGLESQVNKKPNQMSGGQMQRVAIARALVNNPDIILADEPTGALDSKTSVQVMDILKEIAKTRLVIMVTHNNELAQTYANRTISLLDGEITTDTNPLLEVTDVANGEKKKILKKTSMSPSTATSLSFKNLLTKKGRTITTAFAGSIGIIGVALVLAISNGLSNYMDTQEKSTLAGFPITVSAGTSSSNNGLMFMSSDEMFGEDGSAVAYSDDDVVYNYDSSNEDKLHTNVFSDEYLNYIENMENEIPEAVNAITYSHGVDMNVFAKGEDTVVKFKSTQPQMFTRNNYWQELSGNDDFVLSVYDLIGEGSRLPENRNEAVLVVDEYNRLDAAFFDKLGIYKNTESYKLSDFIGKEIVRLIPNDSYYTENENGIYSTVGPQGYEEIYNSESAIPLTITGILRIKESSEEASGFLSEGIAYSAELTDFIVEDAKNSKIAEAQKNSGFDVTTGAPFASEEAKNQMLIKLGADSTPNSINIYPVDYEGKEAITEYLEAYNVDKAEENQVTYTDLAKTIISITNTMMNTVSMALIAFSAISLVVSTIMISIIIYVSVMERTKEIGILRSIGARKKDISLVFITESLLIGLAAGLLGIGITYLLTIPINSAIYNAVEIENVADLTLVYAIALVLGSMGLTLIAGFLPSRAAAKKDPVVALRTE